MVDFKHLSQKMLAKAIGVSPRTIRLWAEDDVPRNDDGSYDIRAVIDWLIDRAKRSQRLKHDPEAEKWLDEWRKEQALRAKLDRLRAEGSLIPRDEVIQIWAWRLKELMTGLVGLAERLPPLLDGRGKNEMSRIIRNEFRDLLGTYARDDGKFCIQTSKED